MIVNMWRIINSLIDINAKPEKAPIFSPAFNNNHFVVWLSIYKLSILSVETRDSPSPKSICMYFHYNQVLEEIAPYAVLSGKGPDDLGFPSECNTLP